MNNQFWNDITTLSDKHKKSLNYYFERLKEENTDCIGPEWCYTTKLLITGYATCLYDSKLVKLKDFKKICDLAYEIYEEKYKGQDIQIK